MNQPNEITLIHKKEKIRIVLSWDEWRDLYGDQKGKFNILRFKNYIGFYIGININFVSFAGNKFRRNELDNFSKLVIKKQMVVKYASL